VLNLARNEIDDEGFQRLAAVFKHNVDLEQVTLTRNKITGTTHVLLDIRPICAHVSAADTWVRSLNKKGASGSFTEAAQAFSSLEMWRSSRLSTEMLMLRIPRRRRRRIRDYYWTRS